MQYLGDIPLATNRSGSCGGSNDIECALHRLCRGDITGRTIVRSYQELYQPEELETMTQILRRYISTYTFVLRTKLPSLVQLGIAFKI